MFMKVHYFVTFDLGFKILHAGWPILPPAPVISHEPLILVHILTKLITLLYIHC